MCVHVCVCVCVRQFVSLNVLVHMNEIGHEPLQGLLYRSPWLGIPLLIYLTIVPYIPIVLATLTSSNLSGKHTVTDCQRVYISTKCLRFEIWCDTEKSFMSPATQNSMEGPNKPWTYFTLQWNNIITLTLMPNYRQVSHCLLKLCNKKDDKCSHPRLSRLWNGTKLAITMTQIKTINNKQ